jgi:pyruvate/2-oxoglutarate/acetoin dehydrogenase E1 component
MDSREVNVGTASEALAHIPGINVGIIATSDEAWATARAAIADPEPCVVIEARELYQWQGDVTLGAVPQTIGGARLHQDGPAMAFITWGAALHKVLAAAGVLSAEGLPITVLDLRWLRPLDGESIARAVADDGGRVLIADGATPLASAPRWQAASRSSTPARWPDQFAGWAAVPPGSLRRLLYSGP